MTPDSHARWITAATLLAAFVQTHGALPDMRATPGTAERCAGNVLRAHEIRSRRTKESALELLTDRLEAHQILVPRSVQKYVSQRLTHVRFSGMTIRGNKVPFIFLAGGDHGDQQEPTGHTL